MRTLSILGSTGSIGTNTLDVVRRHPGKYRVKYLTTNRQTELLASQIAEFSPEAVVIMDPAAASSFTASGVRILTGEEALLKAASDSEVDTVVGALVGFAGLRPTIEAVKAGKRICLANKETLVVAGEIITRLAAESGSPLLPIDSEHSAILQCLVGEDREAVSRIVLTASGGPFRSRPVETFGTITLEEALKHPNWSMGSKITIDSATMMNKGLEVIEAKWLFGLREDQIDVIIHPQSVVHSMVEFRDGSVMAQLGAPDMRLPIQYALEYPERLGQSYDRLDLLAQSKLEFERPDLERFPALRLAREAMTAGGLAPCVLNAANEVAVAAFLRRELPFVEIAAIVEWALHEFDGRTALPSTDSPDEALSAIYRMDRAVREETEERLRIAA